MSSLSKKKPWLTTYHRLPEEDEEFWSAEFEGVDIEGDTFSVRVLSITDDDYEATICTKGINYIKLGSIEMKNLTKCVKKAHKELLWLERES